MTSLFAPAQGRYEPLSDQSTHNDAPPPTPNWTRLSRPARPRIWIIGILILFAICGAFFLRSSTIPSSLITDLGEHLHLKPSPSDTPSPDVIGAPPNVTGGPPNVAVGPDWSKFAYTQYVTNLDYLCNSVMIFETLNRLGSKADRLMMYPDTMTADPGSSGKSAELLRKARDEYHVILEAVHVLHHDNKENTWSDSYTKLLAFNQTNYERVLNVDSDSTILQDMDELFSLPHTPVAMPRAYWGTRDQLSSQIILIEPSKREFDRVMIAVDNAAKGRFDMEIVNDLYRDSAMVIPHRGYDLLTGEFRSDKHEKYLGTNIEPWEPRKVLAEAKFLHFSDWPVPKPWIKSKQYKLDQNEPKCVKRLGRKDDCTNRDIWRGFYNDFARRRKEICGMELNADTQP